MADFLPPADAALLASLAVLADCVAGALALSFFGPALAEAPALFDAALLEAELLDAALLLAEAFDLAGLVEPPSVVPALGPVDVAFAADFFAAIVVPSPVAAQAAGTG